MCVRRGCNTLEMCARRPLITYMEPIIKCYRPAAGLKGALLRIETLFFPKKRLWTSIYWYFARSSVLGNTSNILLFLHALYFLDLEKRSSNELIRPARMKVQEHYLESKGPYQWFHYQGHFIASLPRCFRPTRDLSLEIDSALRHQIVKF